MLIRTFTLLAIIALTGCAGTMSGITGASSSLSCKAPPGVLCSSVSGIYANSLKNALPAQQKLREEVGDTDASSGTPSKTVVRPGEASPAHTLHTLTSGTPVRTGQLVLRVWIAPWEDAEGDLIDQHYLYAVVSQGKWNIEANQERIRAQFRPVYPLKGKAVNGEDQPEAVSQQTEPLSASSPALSAPSMNPQAEAVAK
jgi:conjugal transfer pilus assembly protein TraV